MFINLLNVRFSKTIEKTFCWLLLVQVIVIVLLLCLQGYQFFKESKNLLC